MCYSCRGPGDLIYEFFTHKPPFMLAHGDAHSSDGTTLTVRSKNNERVFIALIMSAQSCNNRMRKVLCMRFMVMHTLTFRRPFQLIALTTRDGHYESSWISITFHADCGQTVWNSSSWNTIVSVYISYCLLPATPISLTAEELSKILIALPRAACETLWNSQSVVGPLSAWLNQNRKNLSRSRGVCIEIWCIKWVGWLISF